MNLNRLKQMEDGFLSRYPDGFNHPEMVAIGKKHKMNKMVEFSQEAFQKKYFEQPHVVIENLVKVISRSSMVSMFEKPKFKSFVSTLSVLETELLVEGLRERLHGDEQQGFEIMLDVMKTGKLAKWSLISICPAYFQPRSEVYVKPTTAKGIIRELQLDELTYKPMPDWSFYLRFRQLINKMKKEVDPTLSPSNAAFTGFLMMVVYPEVCNLFL
ncbi:MAG: hypothetical protein GKR96_06365 [Gammaproteobacteria bacterium]|nr:hypothetical protein [Gammaproteobacteria bacterium]